jgi:hypothetical protein
MIVNVNQTINLMTKCKNNQQSFDCNEKNEIIIHCDHNHAL